MNDSTPEPDSIEKPPSWSGCRSNVTGQEQILTAPEVAKLLRVSTQWVYAHANGNRKPHLPSVKFGGARRFRLLDIQKFVDQFAQPEAA